METVKPCLPCASVRVETLKLLLKVSIKQNHARCALQETICSRPFHQRGAWMLQTVSLTLPLVVNCQCCTQYTCIICVDNIYLFMALVSHAHRNSHCWSPICQRGRRIANGNVYRGAVHLPQDFCMPSEASPALSGHSEARSHLSSAVEAGCQVRFLLCICLGEQPNRICIMSPVT